MTREERINQEAAAFAVAEKGKHQWFNIGSLAKGFAEGAVWADKHPQKKSKWTDDDEDNFRDIIGAIHAVAYQTSEDEEARIEWIKSIKQRMEKQQ